MSVVTEQEKGSAEIIREKHLHTIQNSIQHNFLSTFENWLGWFENCGSKINFCNFGSKWPYELM